MIDLKKNSASGMLVQFADGSSINLVGQHAERIWRLIAEQGIVDQLYLSNGRYEEALFTAPLSMLPFWHAN